ncbi:MAG: hypothetical protein ABJC89_16855, partial [Acidobacteriota bacterium]
QLNEWILAWIAHQLPRVPAHLFQGNIFYPAHDTLAFSEPLIVPALLGAPIAWLGGSPVLVFNLMVIAGFALTAFAGYALVYRWTGDRTAAILSGSTFAFNTHTLTRLAHVQGLHLYGLPLALLATDRLLTTARTRDAWWLAAWMTVLAYTSGYLFVFGAIMVAVAVLTGAADWLPRWSAVLGRLALAAGASALAILPLWLPYRRAAAEQGMVRSLAAVSEYSASLKGYLAASGTIHISTWSAAFFKDPVDSFFPGFVLIVLAVTAVWIASRAQRSPETALMRRRVLMMIAIAITGLVLSLGTRTPVYGWVYAIFPPMHGLRAAARFGNLFLLGMSILGGLGLASWRAGRPRSRQLATIAAALVVAANLEALRAPFEYRRFEGIPRVYTLLVNEPRVILAEVPFYPRQAVFENAPYVLNSTAHWRSLMNGYSGYTPASYGQYADVFWYFPRDYAIEAMRRAGVTHVMVHPERFGRDGDDVVRQISARPELELMAVGAHGIRLYRLH